MKTEHIDWSILRGGIITFFVVLAISVAIITSVYMYRDSAQQDYRQAQAEFRNITSRYLKIDEQEEIIRTYYPRFLVLYKQGVIGAERRLDWLESIQRASDELKIPGLRYEISSQQPARVEWPLDTGRFRLYSSNMTINLNMLHELDLLRLLESLERMNNGFFSVTDCDMNRRRMPLDLSMDSPNVTASCNIRWYSIRLDSGEEIQI